MYLLRVVMNDEVIGKALVELADLMVCTSNDFHNLHFNVKGIEFDTLHRKALKKYYESAANDFDELYEKASMFVEAIPSLNLAAERIGYEIDLERTSSRLVDRQEAVMRCNGILELINECWYKCYCLFNDIHETRCIGVANFLQTRIEYWSKELYYFNARRIV